MDLSLISRRAALVANLLLIATVAVGSPVWLAPQYPSEPGPYLTPYEPAEKLPAGLEEFEAFDLEGLPGQDDEIKIDRDGNVPVGGAVHTKLGTFKFRRAKLISGRTSYEQLWFSTRRIDGVSYTFTGHFLENLEEENGEFVFLEGTLTKFSWGKRLTEGKLRFFQAARM